MTVGRWWWDYFIATDTPLDSGLRRNDKQEPASLNRRPGESRDPVSFFVLDQRHWIPAFAGMTPK